MSSGKHLRKLAEQPDAEPEALAERLADAHVFRDDGVHENELHHGADEHPHEPEDDTDRQRTPHDPLDAVRRPGWKPDDDPWRVTAASVYQPESVYAIHYVNEETLEIKESSLSDRRQTSLRTDDFEWEGGVLSVTGSNSVDMSTVYTYDGGKYIAFASPVARSDKLVVVVHNVTARTAQFRNSIDGGETRIVRQDGTVQFAEDASTIGTQYNVSADLSALTTGDSGVARSGRTWSPRSLSRTPLIVVNQAPKSTAFARGSINASHHRHHRCHWPGSPSSAWSSVVASRSRSDGSRRRRKPSQWGTSTPTSTV